MKKHYDFSKGERGKFYGSDIQLDMPVYLEPKAASFLKKVAQKNKTDVNTIVNDWIKKDIAIIETVTR